MRLAAAGAAPHCCRGRKSAGRGAQQRRRTCLCRARAGPGRLRPACRTRRLRLIVRDTGGRCRGTPPGAASARRCRREALPEGGFGWFLIHDQTDRCSIRREGAKTTWSCIFPPCAGAEGKIPNSCRNSNVNPPETSNTRVASDSFPRRRVEQPPPSARRRGLPPPTFASETRRRLASAAGRSRSAP